MRSGSAPISILLKDSMQAALASRNPHAPDSPRPLMPSSVSTSTNRYRSISSGVTFVIFIPLYPFWNISWTIFWGVGHLFLYLSNSAEANLFFTLLDRGFLRFFQPQVQCFSFIQKPVSSFKVSYFPLFCKHP